MQNQVDFTDILSEYGEGYITRNNIKGTERGIIRLLSACRSAALGSHYEKCDACHYLGKSHNSCRNRHCPLCQHKDKMQWLEKRMKELLPVGYYHLVFTLPHELNLLCLQNKKVMYDLLFKAASETLLELAKDVKHLGADTGLITVLHTWGQNMMEHPHLHCIMPAGGLSFDREHWVHPGKKGDFFIHVRVISRKFRGKFLDFLQQAYDKEQLICKGNISHLSAKKHFCLLKDRLYKKEWVVNIQAPFGSPEKVLEYLSRYVFRVAITNRRIIEVRDGKVLFSWKDYRNKGSFRKMRLDVDEFIRRFLLHILPKGFFKVRYYGIFASRHRSEAIAKSGQLLELEKQDKITEAGEDGYLIPEKHNGIWEEIKKMMHDYKNPNCPRCKQGRLRFAGLVPG
jgi:hypothetical protein